MESNLEGFFLQHWKGKKSQQTQTKKETFHQLA